MSVRHNAIIGMFVNLIRTVPFIYYLNSFLIGNDGDVVRVNWAPAFEGISSVESYTQEYFDAYKAYQRALKKSNTNFVQKLIPGECLGKLQLF